MREILVGTKQVLTHDVILVGLVGYEPLLPEGNAQPKIYEMLAPKMTQAPFVVFARVPGDLPEGTYADRQAIQSVPVQMTSWGRDAEEAWTIAQAVDDAVNLGDWNAWLFPFERFSIIRSGDELALSDEDTAWIQVPATYHIKIAR
jgi:hypothetical protein